MQGVLGRDTGQSSVYSTELMLVCNTGISELSKDEGDAQVGALEDKGAPWSCSSISVSLKNCVKNSFESAKRGKEKITQAAKIKRNMRKKKKLDMQNLNCAL